MSELDIDGVEPTLRVEEESNVLRDTTPGRFPNQYAHTSKLLVGATSALASLQP